MASPVFSNPAVEPFRVGQLPRQRAPAEDLTQYAGHIPVSEDGQGSLFFWLMLNTTLIPDIQAPDKVNKLIVWFNGGPGCTSLDGVFLENGPFQFAAEDDTVERREWSMTEQAVMLYVDQPLGTGFSYAPIADYARDYTVSTDHFLTFLTKFWALFTELRDFDIYLAGESQAGVYIPYIAQEMLRRNDDHAQGAPFPLRGASIGSAWLDPLIQYQALFDFSTLHQLHPASQNNALRELWEQCRADYVQHAPRISSPVCENGVTRYLDLSNPAEGQCYNSYDYRLVDTIPDCGMNWPPKIHVFTEYFRQPEVWRALHVGDRRWDQWNECNTQVGKRLANTINRPSVDLLPDLLDQIPIMLINGDKDILCNYLGVERSNQHMTWGGHQGFREPRFQTWRVDGGEAGYYRSERNLTYVRLFNASHMAGVDAPLELFDLMARLIGTDRSRYAYKSDLLPVNHMDEDEIQLPTKNRAGYFIGTFVITVLLLVAIGYGLYYRAKRRRSQAAHGQEYRQVDPNEDPGDIGGTDKGGSRSKSWYGRFMDREASSSAATLHDQGNGSDRIPLDDLAYKAEFLLDDDTASEATDEEEEEAGSPTTKKAGKRPHF